LREVSQIRRLRQVRPGLDGDQGDRQGRRRDGRRQDAGDGQGRTRAATPSEATDPMTPATAISDTPRRIAAHASANTSGGRRERQ